MSESSTSPSEFTPKTLSTLPRVKEEKENEPTKTITAMNKGDMPIVEQKSADRQKRIGSPDIVRKNRTERTSATRPKRKQPKFRQVEFVNSRRATVTVVLRCPKLVLEVYVPAKERVSHPCSETETDA